MKKLQLPLLIALAAMQWLPWAAHAQTKPNSSGCLVADFRTMALLTHDVTERLAKLKQWLEAHGSKCTNTQLAIIASNRPNWLGTADTIQMAGQIDGLIEAKIADDPEMMAKMYTSKGVKPPTPSVEVTTTPPAPEPVVQPGAQMPGMAIGGSFMQGSPLQPPLPGPNDNAKQREVPDAFFGRRQKVEVGEYFEENRGNGECPDGLIKQADKCVSRIKERDWKLLQPLPPSARLEDLPLDLLVKLGPAPVGHQYKKLEADILLLKLPQNIVTDAVLDLGGLKAVEAKSSSPQRRAGK